MWSELHKAMYGGEDTVFATSGHAVAVYHPKLEPEKPSNCKNPDCPVHNPKLSDPTLNDAQSDEFADSNMPEAMVKEIRENMAKDPEKTAEVYHDLTYHLVKRWRKFDVSPAKLRRMSLSMTGMDLKQVAPDKDGIEWMYIPPDLSKAKFLGFFNRKTGEYFTKKARERGEPHMFMGMQFAILPQLIPVEAFISQRVINEQKAAEAGQ